MSETLPSPLLLGTDGQKGRVAEMVMKSPARDYRSCCDDGCRSWQSWSCRQRRSGEENRGGRRQANLTRTQSSLLRSRGPNRRCCGSCRRFDLPFIASTSSRRRTSSPPMKTTKCS
ncbi:hypothetical protein ACFX2C_032367 [Malus domestica]